MRLNFAAALILGSAITGVAFAQADSTRWTRFIATTDSLRQTYGVPAVSYALIERARVVAAGGLGYADVAARTPATDTTLYPIASLTKPIAAVALFQLVEARKLDLDTRMSVILKDYRFNARILGYAARCENIAFLAGLDDPDVAPYRSLFEDYRCRTEPITVRHHLTHMAQGVPGTAYRYNGFLYGMLAPVVEVASGKSFWSALREGILRPSGMDRTTFSPENGDSATAPVVALSYRRDSTGQAVPSTCQDCGGLNAGSGLVSSTSDLARFVIALSAGSLISDSLRRVMITPARTNAGARSPYANGWFRQDIEGMVVLWHYGYLPGGYSGLLIIIPDRNVALILLGNSDGLSAEFDLGQGDVLRSPFARAFMTAVK
ncbi:MAG: serine hydrolase domain-containing protein [Gemmatimonadota bacterium]